MEFAKLFSIVLSLGIGSFALALRYRVTYSWSHPAVIFAIFWFAMTILPLVGVWNMPVEPIALAYILGAVAAFGVPAVLVNWKSAAASAIQRNSTMNSRNYSTLLLVGLQVIVVATIVANLHHQGFPIRSYIENPLGTSTAYLNASSEGHLKPFPLASVGFILLYVAAALGGLAAVRSNNGVERAFIFAITFVPSLMHILFYSLKGTVFLAGAVFFGGVLAGRVQRGDLSLINRATIKVALGLLVPAVALLVFAMLARPGQGMWGQDEQAAKVVYYLKSYAFGHLYAFSDWFSSYFLGGGTMAYTDPGRLTFGYWTFMALGEYVNPEYNLPPGYYDEYYGVDKVLKSNIFTIFRGMIYDFTLIGSFLFMGAAGAICSYAYRRMLLVNNPVVSQTIFIFAIGAIYQSYIFSMFAWSSTIAAIVLTAALLSAQKFFETRAK